MDNEKILAHEDGKLIDSDGNDYSEVDCVIGCVEKELGKYGSAGYKYYDYDEDLKGRDGLQLVYKLTLAFNNELHVLRIPNAAYEYQLKKYLESLLDKRVNVKNIMTKIAVKTAIGQSGREYTHFSFTEADPIPSQTQQPQASPMATDC